MNKEIRFAYDDPRLKNPNFITQLVTEELRKAGLDIMMNDCVELIDDDDKRQRILKIRTRTVTVAT